MPPRKSTKTDPVAAVERRIAADRVEFVRFEQSDTHGISRSKTVPVRHFRHFAEDGLNFLLGHLGFDVQAFVAPGTGYLEEVSFPDSRIRPDLNTYEVVPWADRTARVLCEPHFVDGRRAMAAPRAVARKLLGELEDLGYRLYSGFEYEFYLVNRDTRQPPFQGIQIFATLRNNFDEALVHQILRGMSAMGVDIITSNAEYGPGQMEINFAPAEASPLPTAPSPSRTESKRSLNATATWPPS
jgi:glutamine synthetase